MPIRVNLKEIFPADSQEITVDKINFNFNKLLELGIGEQGLIGLTGPVGGIGPIGNQGEEGVRGSQWYVDSVVDPNTLTFQDLLPGDLYLDSTNISIWQWNGSSWTFVVDLTGVINNYLAASPSPFVRGLGIGGSSNKDQRFILFNRRGNTSLDIANDTLPGGAGSNSSNNDILFLNNFNEDTLEALLQSQFPPGFEFGPALTPTGNQIASSSLFNSLVSVYLDHTSSILGRYHLDMGVLYENDPLTPNQEPRITNVFENFKMRYLRVGSSVHPGQDHYNVSLFTMDVPEVSNPAIYRVTNGVFKFQSPKLLPTVDNEKSEFYIGSRYGLDEIIGTSNSVKTDGILFIDEIPTIYGNIGIAKNYVIPNLPNTGYIQNVSAPVESYFMISASGSVEAVLIDQNLYQNSGNIIQAGTSVPRTKYQTTTAFTSPGSYSQFIGHMGISTDGENIYTFSGCFSIDATNDLGNKFGYYNKYNIDNPNRPLGVSFLGANKVNGLVRSGATPPPGCNPVYNFSNIPIGPGVSDLVISGKYAYVVSTQNIAATDSYSIGSGPGQQFFERTYFQVLKLDEVLNTAPLRVARIGQGELAGSTSGGTDPEELNSAYRVKMKDRFALVATNALYNSSSPTFLGVNALVLPNEDYQGRITAVDVTFPEQPKIVASGSQSSSQFVVTAPSGIRRAAIMDFEVVGDKVFALTWEQNVATLPRAGTPVCNIVINLNVYDISGLETSSNLDSKLAPVSEPSNAISWEGRGSSNFISVSGVDNTGYGQLFKRGAVASKDRLIYAGWSNEIRTFSTYSPQTTGSLPNCVNTYAQVNLFTLPFSSGAYNGIVDMKRIGNTLWVLALVDGESKVYKLDVSGGLSTSSSAEPVLVSEKTITQPATRFEVIGKHIYLACHNTANNDSQGVSLITLDFDGIYTDGGHIGSLRTDKLNATGSVEIGKDLKVQGAITTGAGIRSDSEISAKLMVPELIYTRKYEDYEALVNVQTGENGGFWFKGLDANRANYDALLVLADTKSGQWSIQYHIDSSTDQAKNGINFNKPFPSTNWGNYKLFLADNGNLSIGVDILSGFATEKLDVNGNARFRAVTAGSYANPLNLTANGTLTTATSDERLKTNIESISGALNKICNLRGVTFEWIDSPELGTRVGLIAQEVEQVVPELVFTNENSEEKYKGVHYSETVALLIEAIKEQQAMIADLKERVNQLENLNAP